MTNTDSAMTTRFNGEIQWLNDVGQLHRLDGPAVVHPRTGFCEYWVNGLQFPEREFHSANFTQLLEHLPASTPINDWETKMVLPNGDTLWRDQPHGRLNRSGKPAVERVDGTKEWYQKGILHRLDGPAIEHPNHPELDLHYVRGLCQR